MTTTPNLTVTTPSDREIAMSRVFRAPRTLVWDAYTKPELVKRWLGVFGEMTMPVCEIDLRVGGGFRYVWRGPNGFEMGMRGTFREITRPERIVNSEKFDQAWYEGEAQVTLLLTEKDGQTTATTTVLYASRAVRDGVLKSPMSTGVAAGFDELEKLLATLAGAS
jgi:uncharacterized protein YndB with AHSA1/START domain